MKHLVNTLVSLATLLAVLTFLWLVCGCTTTPTAPTDRQVAVANAVEDVISVGLVPVLAKNPRYVPEARAVAAAFSLSKVTAVTASDVEAFLSTTTLAPEDSRIVAGLVLSSWDIYQRRYAQQVSASVRPDVGLFLQAVAAGIERAIAATPK